MTYLRSSSTPSVVPKQITDKLFTFVDVTRPKGQVSCDWFFVHGCTVGLRFAQVFYPINLCY